HVRRVLSLDLSQANTRLVAVAREQRLADVVQALRAVGDDLGRAAPDHPALRELGGLTGTLDGLRQALEELVREHDRWQSVDNELRSAADGPGGAADEVALAW